MRASFFEKHPFLTLGAFTVVMLCGFALAAEIILRFAVSYDIGYYTAVRKEGVYEYPYGRITINSLNYPDSEFNLSSAKQRIGYLGDSVVMGVGAGDGYRFSDILEREYPQYEHWTFAMMDNGLSEANLLEIAEKFRLSSIVYGFNLNDFLPPSDSEGQPVAGAAQSFTEQAVQAAGKFTQRHLDWLRDKSYLYSVLRAGARNMFQSFGYGHTGFKAVELYPTSHENIIRDTAMRLNGVAAILKDRGIDFCFVILPYDMQISQQAAQTYRAMGIDWEDGFENGSTQDIFKRYLNFPVYDARTAFAGAEDQPAGTFFVFDKGDKIDFNHPNRAGHARLAEGIRSAQSCVFLQN